MKKILEKYINQEVGINIERPFKIEGAQLIMADDNFFTIQDHDKNYIHHFSYSSIVQIIENKEGIEVGGMFEHKKLFQVVIKVGHIFEYIPA